MIDEQKEEEIRLLLDRGAQSLRAAEELVKLGFYNDASSRAYYAAFHAVQAVLLFKDLVFSKHRAVIGAFRREFIKTGIFSEEFSSGIERLFENRQTGDYGTVKAISPEQANDDVQTASRILKTLTQWLEGKLETED